jgi:thiamine-phosphate pyrophosphorylase
MTAYIRYSPRPALALAAARLLIGPFCGQAGAPRLLLLTDSERLPDPETAVARLPRGIRSRSGQRFRAGVVVRERNSGLLEKLVFSLMPLCHRLGIALIVANDVKLALRHGADGVHLSEKLSSKKFTRLLSDRRRFRRRFFVTASAHGERGMRRDAAIGVDSVLIAPVFATKSHPGSPALGAVRFAALVDKSRRFHRRINVVALGGVSSRNANRLMAAGASGFAAIESLS